MRLEKYLNESFDFDIKILRDNEWVKKIGFPIYKGINSNIDVLIRTPRTDRIAKSGNNEKHVISNKIFNEMFGWKARSEGLMVTGKFEQAETFGRYPYMIFPVGKFKYVYSPDIEDFIDIGLNDDMTITTNWSHIRSRRLENYLKLDDNEVIEKYTEFLKSNYTDQGLSTHSGDFIGEIMLKCDEYVAIRIDNNLHTLKRKIFK